MAAMKMVYGFRIKPARFEDWRALSREGDKVLQRLGGHNLRSFAPTAAGPESTVCYATIDFVDGAHLGMFLDAAARDLEAQTFNERMTGHTDSPIDLLYVSTISEIPLDHPKAQGPVLDVWISKVRPGRFDDSLAFVNETAPLAVENGAVGVHLYSVDAAGSEVGRTAWTAEYESFEALGRSQDMVAAKPEIREIMQRLSAPDAPFEIVQHSIMGEVPLH